MINRIGGYFIEMLNGVYRQSSKMMKITFILQNLKSYKYLMLNQKLGIGKHINFL